MATGLAADDDDDEFTRDALRVGFDPQAFQASLTVKDILADTKSAPPALAASAPGARSAHAASARAPAMSRSRPDSPTVFLAGVNPSAAARQGEANEGDSSSAFSPDLSATALIPSSPVRSVRNMTSERHGILRLDVLGSISRYLSRSDVKQSVGLPTVLWVGKLPAQTVIVGSSRGVALVFESVLAQPAGAARARRGFALLRTLGSVAGATASDVGAVTAVHVSDAALPGEGAGGACVLAALGHESGLLAVWDLAAPKPLKVLGDVHRAAVTALQFSHTRPLLVSADALGCVVLTSLSRSLLAVRATTRVIVPGSAGSVLQLRALPKLSSAVDAWDVIALATAARVTVLALQPDVRVLMQVPLPPELRDTSPPPAPVVAWRPSVAAHRESSGGGAGGGGGGGGEQGGEADMPLIACAWGPAVTLVRLRLSPGGAVEGRLVAHRVISHRDVPLALVGLEWLGPSVLAGLTALSELLILDPATLQTLEAVGVSAHDLVRLRHALPGGAGELGPRLTGSLCVDGRFVFLLGLHAIATATVLTWAERLAALVQRGHLLQALALALEFHEDRSAAVIGLPTEREARRRLTAQQLGDLLVAYVELFFAAPPALPLFGAEHDSGSGEGSAETLRQAQGVAGLCVEYWLRGGLDASLLATLHDRFVRVHAEGAFLNALAPLASDGRVRTPPASVSHALLAHLHGARRLEELQRVVLSLDPAGSLDLHQAATLCRQERLFEAVTHVYTAGLNDYVTAAAVMLDAADPPAASTGHAGAQSAAASAPSAGAASSSNRTSNGVQYAGVDDDLAAGYRLLLYLAHCMLGKTLSAGDIAPERLPSVKREILGWMFEGTVAAVAPLAGAGIAGGGGGGGGGGTSTSTSTGTTSASSGAVRLARLLRLDVRELLRVLSLVLDDASLGDVVARPRVALAVMNVLVAGEHGWKLDLAQSLVERATAAIAASAEPRAPFSASDVTALYAWLGKHYAAGRLELHAFFLDALLLHLIESARVPEAEAARPQAQTRALVLVQQDIVVAALSRRSRSPGSGTAAFDVRTRELLAAAERVDALKVCEALYRQTGDFARVIPCYLRDPFRRTQVFVQVRMLLASPAVDAAQRAAVKAATLNALHTLIELHSLEAAALMVDCFADDHEQVMARLEAFPELLYVYLKALVDGPRDDDDGDDDGGNGGGSLNEGAVGDGGAHAGLDGDASGEAASVAASQALAARSSRERRAAIALQMQETFVALMCVYDPSDVAAYLRRHERYRLDVCLGLCRHYGLADASAYLLERLGDVQGALALVTADFASLLAAHAFDKLLRTVAVAVGLCQRTTQRYAAEDSEELWFALLDLALTPLSNADSCAALDAPQRDALDTVMRRVLDGMAGYVPTPAILTKIVRDHGSRTFGEFRDVIVGIFDTFRYETVLLATTTKILNHDCHKDLAALLERLRRPMHTDARACAVCSDSLQATGAAAEALRVFQCGHTCHRRCARVSARCPACNTGPEGTASSRPRGEASASVDPRIRAFTSLAGASDGGEAPARGDGALERLAAFRRATAAADRLYVPVTAATAASAAIAGAPGARGRSKAGAALAAAAAATSSAALGATRGPTLSLAPANAPVRRGPPRLRVPGSLPRQPLAYGVASL